MTTHLRVRFPEPDTAIVRAWAQGELDRGAAYRIDVDYGPDDPELRLFPSGHGAIEGWPDGCAVYLCNFEGEKLIHSPANEHALK